MKKLNVVTGAFGYSGSYIAKLLTKKGLELRTLTNKKVSDEERAGIEVIPYCFEDPEALCRALEGADTLYNTYWVRFNYGDRKYGLAVENTKRLIKAAVRAGVRRIVHVSITNPSEESQLPYFKSKAVLEREIMESGLSYAILRPTVLFGKEDILINNISWFLRKFPIFGMLGNGKYKLKPVFVEDLAALAVEQGARDENVVLDAVGPEIFSFKNLVSVIRHEIGSKALVVRMPAGLALAASRVAGRLLGDVVITEDEVKGLSAGLLVSSDPPTCPTRFSDWLKDNKDTLGIGYSSELKRHYQ